MRTTHSTLRTCCKLQGPTRKYKVPQGPTSSSTTRPYRNGTEWDAAREEKLHSARRRLGSGRSSLSWAGSWPMKVGCEEGHTSTLLVHSWTPATTTTPNRVTPATIGTTSLEQKWQTLRKVGGGGSSPERCYYRDYCHYQQDHHHQATYQRAGHSAL